MQENYLAKWLNNELTEEELSEFKKSEEYASYQRILQVTGTLEPPDYDMEEALRAIKNKQTLHSKKVVQLHPFKKFLRIAAAIAVIITASYFYLNTLDEHYTTQYAENEQIELPDTSTVLLNADSELSYSDGKWDEERNVKLKGEAFFKVAKGKKFTVDTKAGTIAVLGTQFNVVYRKDFFEVTCFEGLVSVTFDGNETKLPAGTSFMAISGKIVESAAPNTTQPSWVNHESSFKSVPLRFVIDEFERQHNISVETKNVDTDQLFTGTFSNTDKNLALKSIAAPSQIKYTLEGGKVLFYGDKKP
ncbi:FecR family protein [Pareuzebyella sediminis]|uniref:FecR family protein n=1 Tax=Pareuzebyella sediminis TaxID=2607998 RepID=UPI0011EBF3C9|nr:FecR family protein [Pareuzebyella sediminis]